MFDGAMLTVTVWMISYVSRRTESCRFTVPLVDPCLEG